MFPGVQTNFSCFPEPVSLAEPGGAFNRINPSLAAVTKTDFSTKRSICISRALTWFFLCGCSKYHEKGVSRVAVAQQNNRVIRQCAPDLAGQLIHPHICLNYSRLQKRNSTIHSFWAGNSIFHTYSPHPFSTMPLTRVPFTIATTLAIAQPSQIGAQPVYVSSVHCYLRF